MATTSERLRGMTPSQRADAIASMISSAGELSVEKAREFFRVAQNATPLLKAARVVEMTARQYAVPKILFVDPILKADPGDGTALGSGSRAAPTTSEVSLVAKEYVGTIKLGDQMIEDNIERQDIEATIMEMIAERVGIDLEALALGSDTTIVDATLVANGYDQQDGWLKKITSNVVNFSSGDVNRAKMNSLYTSIALKFRQRAQHQYFMEEYAGETWRNIIGDRATALGDKSILEGSIPPANGRPVIQVGNMPVTSGTPNVSSAILTDPRNLLLGWHRQIRLEADRRPQERATYIVVSLRAAFAVEHEAAAAKGTNVKAR